MRINKRFIPSKKLQARNSLTIYFEDVRKIVGILVGTTLLCIVGFIIFTFVHPSKAENSYYKNTCDMLAGNNKHYFSRQGSPGDELHSMKCHIIESDGTERMYRL